MTCRVKCFTPSIKGKTLATFYKSLLSCVLNLLSDLRGVYLQTYTLSYQDQDSHQELNDCFSCYIKNFQENLKPLRGVSKSQVGEFVVVVDQGKK